MKNKKYWQLKNISYIKKQLLFFIKKNGKKSK